MKRNVLPFGIIAIVGIFAAVIVFYIGVSQEEEIQLAEENDGEEAADGEEGEDGEDGETEDDPEAMFASSCASCHGDDLTGGMGPDLTSIGSDHSAEDIQEIIANGQGDMPPGTASPDEAEIIADWLSSEMK